MMNMDGRRIIPVFVVLPPRTLLLDVAGPVEVLRKANLHNSSTGFQIRYLAPEPDVTTSIGLRLSAIEPLPAELPDGAIVLISGNTDQPIYAGSPEHDSLCEEQICRWLATVTKPGIRLVTICSGALLAARAGLFDGRDCTTHFSCCDMLRRLASGARVLENRLFVDDGDRLSSAGVTAGIDLALHLVTQEAGPACAVAVARDLLVYLRRGGGDPQLSPWLEGRNHIHPAVHRVQDAIVSDPARAWSLESLASIAIISPRHLSRLFNDYVTMSVSDYINRTRIALAQNLLATSRLDMEHVAERAGFSSARHFRRVWKQVHDLPPSRMRTSGKVA